MRQVLDRTKAGILRWLSMGQWDRQLVIPRTCQAGESRECSGTRRCAETKVLMVTFASSTIKMVALLSLVGLLSAAL